MPTSEKTIVLAVAERLARASTGDLISHEAIRAIVGPEFQDRHWSITRRAIDLLNKEGGVVFASVRSEGYRRLPAGDGVQYLGDVGMRRIRGAARRTIRRLSAALHHANDLGPEATKLANQRLCSAGLVEHLTRAQTVRHLPEERPVRPDPLAGLRAAIGA